MLRKIFARSHKNPASTPNPGSPPDIPGLLNVKSTQALLTHHSGLMVQIEELAGISKPHFETFYRQPIEAFARFVQCLPASEVHHHAGPGGMLAHGLEVCVNALKIRRSYLLSETGIAEEISAKQDLWTYAIFCGALTHDLAKVAVDQRVTVYDNRHQDAIWEPWSKFIDEYGSWYTTEFVRHRQYRLHEKASPLLVHRVIPEQGMKWLASDPYIFSHWLAAVSGDQDVASTVSEIVSKADQQSVALNLGADGSRMTGVKTKPLHEKIITALRFLLAEGELPLNRNGAAGWVQDDVCWLVSKRTVDAIREQLTTEGHTGIPTKNGRMFDVMQEHGILIPCGDRAIWSATVQGEDFSHDLTLIKIPASTLWPNANQKPENFAGKVLAEQPDTAPPPAQTTAEANQRQPEKERHPDHAETTPTLADKPVKQSRADADNTKRATAATAETQPQTITPVNPPAETAAFDSNDILQFLPSETAPASDDAPDQTTQPVLEKTETTPEQEPDKAPETNQKPASEKTVLSHQTPAKQTIPAQSAGDQVSPVPQFFDWLQQQIKTNQLTVNRPKARVHVVAEGVILVTPGIFQDFAKSKANTGQLSWNSIQQKVLKKNWHVRDAKGLNVIKYSVKGQNRRTTINAVLFEDKSRIFGDMTPPDANVHLQRE